MQLATYIMQQSGKPFAMLFGPAGLVELHADADGAIRIARWSNQVGIPMPTPEQIIAILALPDPLDPALVRDEFARRIEAAFQGKRPSILSYAIALNGRVSTGLAANPPLAIAQSLTAEEQADVQLIWALDAWEGQMIERREALIAAADATFADDAHWIVPPAGLTADWLRGF